MTALNPKGSAGASMAVTSRLLVVLLTFFTAYGQESFVAVDSPAQRLRMIEVLESVTAQYPPYLAALIERDVAAGKLLSTRGAFDFNTFARVFNNPTGFYESTTVEAGFEQFLGLWGSTLYGGYRYTDGLLPDYYYQRRTNEGGTPNIGLKIPLLQDGSIDTRRAAILKADLDRLLVDPQIRRQHLDFTRAAMVSYFSWLGAGLKLIAAEDLLRNATDRITAIDTLIEKGLTAPVVSLENQQLIASRRISLTKAQREFEASTIALSLFFRDSSDDPVLAVRAQVPDSLPPLQNFRRCDLQEGIDMAMNNRPEIEAYEIEFDKLDIDRDLFTNKLLPKLNTTLSAEQSLGSELYKDQGQLEMKLGLEFELPLQRRDARGKLEENRAKIRQLENKLRFALDKIRSEVQNYHSAFMNALDQFEQAQINFSLAEQLQSVELDRFNLGATDLLALQIREQAAFRARIEAIDASVYFLKSLGDFLIAAGVNPGDQTLNGTGSIDEAVRWLTAR